jgi:hypothetical protein
MGFRIIPFNSYKEIGPFDSIADAKDYAQDEAFLPLSEIRIVTSGAGGEDIVVFGPSF